MGDLRGKMGRRVDAMLTPTNLFLLLGVLTSVPVLVQIDQEMQSESARGRTHRYTHRLTVKRKPAL